MKEKILILCIAFLTFSQLINAQSEKGKLVIGIGSSSVLFDKEGASKIKQRYNVQVPRINVTGELSDKFSIDLALTFNVIGNIEGLISNAFEYTSFDATVRYNLFKSDAVIVPYIGAGVSYIGGATTAVKVEDAFSLNILAGGTLWVTDKFGLISQLTYKHVSSDVLSMVSHIQGSAGIAFRFGSGGEGRKRLWDK